MTARQHPVADVGRSGSSIADAAYSRGARGQHADRGQQLADQLRPRLRYGLDPERPEVSFDGNRLEPITADVVIRAWRRTHNGMNGQGVPTDADLARAAEIIQQRAVAAARAAAEQRAVAADADRARQAADEAASEAATDARRRTLLAELEKIDNP